MFAVRDVQCDDEMVNEFNAFFRMAGRYRIAPDYALGDSDEQKSQLFVSYMTSNMTADEYETNYERITRNAIAASGKIKSETSFLLGEGCFLMKTATLYPFSAFSESEERGIEPCGLL